MPPNKTYRNNGFGTIIPQEEFIKSLRSDRNYEVYVQTRGYTIYTHRKEGTLVLVADKSSTVLILSKNNLEALLLELNRSDNGK